MKINTEYIWSDYQQRYLLVKWASFNEADVILCKGATSQQTQLADTSQAFNNTLISDYGQQFSKQSNILGAITASLQPIMNAGAGQYGFSNAEDAVLRNQATSGTSAAYRSARQATGEAQAAQGGGGTFIGSGVQAQNQANLAQKAAGVESSEQLGITHAGYAQGRQNYQNALSGMGGVAGMYNPSGFAGEANQSGQVADTEANAVQAANQQMWNNLTGLATGAMGGAASALGGA